MNNLKLLSILVISIFLFTFVSAQPPMQTTTNFYFENGLAIVDSPQNIIRQNTNYEYNFFVYNRSNGVLLDNSTIDCLVYVANPRGQVLYYDQVDYFLEGYFGETLNSSIFSELGYHAYGVQCQDSNTGGALAGMWDVTPKGYSFSEEHSNLYIGILFSIVLLSFFFALVSWKFLDKEKTFPFGLFFLLVSFILIVYSLYLGVLYSQNFLLESMVGVHSRVFVGIMYGLVGATFLGLTLLIVKVLSEFKERKSLIKYGEGYNSKTKSYD